MAMASWRAFALAVGLAAAALPTFGEAGQGVEFAVQGRSLAEALKQLSARSGIRFQLADGLGLETVAMRLQGGTWADIAQSLLQGYNYAVEAGPDGAWRRVTVAGRNGDGRGGPGRSLAARAASGRTSTLPPRFQGYKPGSVTPITLPLATLKGMKKGQKIVLDLPFGAHALVHDNRFAQGNEDVTWVGYAEADGLPYRTLITLGRAGPMGHVITPDGTYQIVTEGGQSYLIDLKASGLQAGSLAEDQAAPPAAAAAEREEAAAAPGGRVTIDLLVLHTKGLAQADARVSYLAALANQALLDSKINAQIRIVGRQPVDYPESNGNSEALADLTEGKAGLAKVSAWREQYGADLVTLLRPLHANGQKSCGIAWVNGSNGSPLNPARGFSVVGDGDDEDGAAVYCAAQALAHELGHNLGLVHDREFSGFPGAFPYAYAWGVEGQFGTIMSYRQPGLLLFATPLLGGACRGQPCGYAEGEPNASDDSKAVNQTAPVVAGFRAPAGAEKKP